MLSYMVLKAFCVASVVTPNVFPLPSSLKPYINALVIADVSPLSNCFCAESIENCVFSARLCLLLWIFSAYEEFKVFEPSCKLLDSSFPSCPFTYQPVISWYCLFWADVILPADSIELSSEYHCSTSACTLSFADCLWSLIAPSKSVNEPLSRSAAFKLPYSWFIQSHFACASDSFHRAVMLFIFSCKALMAPSSSASMIPSFSASETFCDNWLDNPSNST